MARDHLLAYALAAVVLINIIAIILLNNRLADQQTAAGQGSGSGGIGSGSAQGNANEQPPVTGGPQQAQPATGTVPAAPIVHAPPPVRTLLLQDTARCPDCFGIGAYIDALNGTVTMQVERVGPQDLPLFNLTRLPAIAFNKTLELYPSLSSGWEQVGSIVNITSGPYAGEWYVLPSLNAPYYDMGSNAVRGLVTVTYLTDASCAQCYNISLLRTFLNASRVYAAKENTYDIGSQAGEALAEKYNITEVPTMLLDSEASYYQSLQPSWNVVGSVEPDGTYVLRDIQRLQVPYYDLATKQVMTP